MRLSLVVGLVVVPAVCWPLWTLPTVPAIAATEAAATTADALYQTGEQLFYRGQYAAALEKLTAAARQAQAVGNLSIEAAAWTTIALLHVTLGESDLSRQAIDQAMALHDRFDDPLGRAETLRVLVNVDLDVAPDEDVIAMAETALAIAREQGDLLLEGILLADLGALEMQRSRYESGRELLSQSEQALSAAAATGDDPLVTENYRGLNLFWQGLGAAWASEFETGQAAVAQMLAIAQANDLYPIEGLAWYLGGIVHQNQENYVLARSSHRKAVDIFDRIEAHNLLQFALVSLGEIEIIEAIAQERSDLARAQQGYEQGISHFQRALALAEEREARTQVEQYRQLLTEAYILLTSVHSDFADQYLNLGQDQVLAGEFEVALESLQQSEAAAQQAIETILLAEVTPDNKAKIDQWQYFAHNALVSAYLWQGWSLQSLSQFEQRLQIAQRSAAVSETALSYAIASGNAEIILYAYANIITVYDSLGLAEKDLAQFAASESAYETGLAYARQAQDPEQERSSLERLQWLHADWGRHLRAAGEYEQALHISQIGLQLGEELLALADDSTTPDEEWFQDALRGQSLLHSNIALIYADLGEPLQELAAYQRGLALAEQLTTSFERLTYLKSVAVTYYELTRYQESLELWQQLLALDQVQSNPVLKGEALIFIALIYDGFGRYDGAIATYEQALTIARAEGDLEQEHSILNNLATIHDAKGEYDQALEWLEQGLQLTRRRRAQIAATTTSDELAQVCLTGTFQDDFVTDAGEYQVFRDSYTAALNAQSFAEDRQDCLNITWSSEATTFNNIAVIYDDQGRYEEALALYETSLEITRSRLRDRASEATTLSNIALVYFNQGDYQKAAELVQQVLTMRQALGDQYGETLSLNDVGMIYEAQGRYDQAQTYVEQALTQAQSLGIKPVEPTLRNNLALIYRKQAQYDVAERYHTEAITLSRELGLTPDEALSLSGLGHLRAAQGQYAQAVDYLGQALAIFDESGSRKNESIARVSLGAYLDAQGYYAEALDQKQQALAIAEAIGALNIEGYALEALGTTYRSLGQLDKALEYSQAAIAIYRDIGDRASEADTLVDLGLVYDRQTQPDRALNTYQQALAIYRDIGSVQGESTTLANMGFIHMQLADHSTAETLFAQALDIQQAIGARGRESITLNGLALAQAGQNQAEKALNLLQQSLALHRELGDRPNEARVLSDIGKVLAQQGQSETAIIFLKAAVKLTEDLRGNIQGLALEDQVAYADSVSDRYRQLADLLLEQGNIPEAQQVLDLLKLEELREFNDPTRATWTGTELVYTDPEQAVIDAHDSLIALGTARVNCVEAADCDQLDDQLQALKAQYDAQVAEFEATIRANRQADDEFVDPDNISGDAKDLLDAYAAAGQNALLIYPFVLEDKLWLVWAAAGRAIGSVEVPVEQGELAATVQRLGELLTTPTGGNELQATSQQLYDWLIRPLETELTQNEVDHLIFVSDRVTRYIPMAVLSDGEHYLLERYTISSVLAPGLTDTDTRLTAADSFQVLGLGLTQAVSDFPPLPAVSEELDGIILSDGSDAAGVYPGRVLLDEAFTLDSLEDNVRRHQVLHMATHAAFVPGRAEQSYIMLGDGGQLTIPDIEAMEHRLEDLHLVVLSACQTALGGTAGDGTEIAGISSYFLEKGRAETVVASLWQVNDNSTSLLMQRFYEFLASGELTKAEALRQAQLSLLYGEDTATRLAAARGSIAIEPLAGRSLATTGLAHPYHWAPFILIGNGL
ncbi:MAG: tetratricopeptide repeat protein [Leptolyngbyaceae cyanobacterium]